MRNIGQQLRCTYRISKAPARMSKENGWGFRNRGFIARIAAGTGLMLPSGLSADWPNVTITRRTLNAKSRRPHEPGCCNICNKPAATPGCGVPQLGQYGPPAGMLSQ